MQVTGDPGVCPRAQERDGESSASTEESNLGSLRGRRRTELGRDFLTSHRRGVTYILAT